MIKKFMLAGVLASCLFNKTVAGNKPFAGNEPLFKKTTLSFEKKSLYSSKKRRSDKVIGIGGQASVLKLLSPGAPTLFGFGVNGLFSIDGERNAFFADLNYYLPGNSTTTDYGYAHSSLTTPREIEVDVKTKLSGIGFRIGYRRYFINDISDDGFKLYLQAAGGLLLFKGTSEASGYNTAEYYTSFEPTFTATGFTIGGGFGAEYSVDSKINIFAEIDANIPANQVNGEEVEVEIPLSAQFVIGARFHF